MAQNQTQHENMLGLLASSHGKWQIDITGTKRFSKKDNFSRHSIKYNIKLSEMKFK